MSRSYLAVCEEAALCRLCVHGAQALELGVKVRHLHASPLVTGLKRFAGLVSWYRLMCSSVTHSYIHKLVPVHTHSITRKFSL